MILWAEVATGQTKVDLHAQAKSADLSTMGPTKPAQVGTILPGVCSGGELFFKSDAAPGTNLYACTSANIWTVLAGGGGAGTGNVSGLGASVAGNLPVYSDATGRSITDSGVAGSTAVLMTHVRYQEGTPLDCSGALGDTGASMNCLLDPTLGAYALHMLLRFTPRVSNSGTFTLNIDMNGSKAVKSSDCSSDPPAGYFQAQQTYLLTYNGTLFCEVHAGGSLLAAPYQQFGGAFYLPFSFAATLPPVSGWSAVNFTGATFSTSGLGGAIQINTPSSRSGESLNLQILSRGTTSTLVAVLAASGIAQASNPGACGIGVHDSGSTATYLLMQQLGSSSPLVEAGYTTPTVRSFAGDTALAGVGNVLFLRLQVIGGNITTSYSATGAPNTWTQIHSRAMGSSGVPASATDWAFLAEAAGVSPVACQLLSWSIL